MGQQAFAVIREAIRKEGMVAVGKVVFTSREHIIALEARGKGMHRGHACAIRTRFASEKDYFDDIADEKVPKDMLDLAIAHRQYQARGFRSQEISRTNTRMPSRS